MTFDLGSNSNTITIFVDVLDDVLVEATESFALTGGIGNTAAPGAAFVGGPATVIILDDDGKFGYDYSQAANSPTNKFMGDRALIIYT